MHRNSHSEICIAVARITTDKYFSDTYPSLEHWIASRDDILQRILPSLSRYVCQYEKEMILCAKSCYVCYRQINRSLCNICYSANFCDDHQVEFSYYMGRTADNITFINGYVHRNDRHTRPKMLDDHNSTLAWTLDQYVYSEVASESLTLYYASNLLSVTLNARKYIVQLIDANRIDVVSLQIWHIFLGYFTIKELHIVLIQSPIFKSRDLCSVCSTCHSNNASLDIQLIFR
ncbi:uncharacterized protein LOC116850745 isoform X2 [Odontomachus brunneus]|nr:uncharacterized protein LOC116850745 isoform X2 [Odontomachus brunneus]